MGRIVYDQLNRPVEFKFPPCRIISLVPSQTELLHDLGLEEEVLGITRFCIHPIHWQETKSIIGGTRKLNLEKIRALNPELVIGNKEENDRIQVEMLMKFSPVWISDVRTVEEACQMIEKVGLITGKFVEAAKMTSRIRASVSSVPEKLTNIPSAYLIWRKPWMAAGRDTFIHNMMSLFGLQNIMDDQIRYPQITLEALKEKKPRLILLSSEPYPFREKHINEVRRVLTDAEIVLVDGEMFSWYGSHLLHAIQYIQDLRSYWDKNIPFT